MTSFSLIDAYARSLEFPDTFPFLGFNAIAEIRPGALVKIGVEFDGDPPTGERFWVIVERAFEEGLPHCFRGRWTMICAAQNVTACVSVTRLSSSRTMFWPLSPQIARG